MRMKKNILAVICLCLVSALSWGCGEGGGTIVIGSMENENQEDALSGEAADGSTSGGSPVLEGQEALILVYVCGAVVNPGVVAVPEGSRAEDALLAAGGFSEEAERAAVNLADWVEDGQMLYFPTKEEALERAGREAAADFGLVNINTADAALLCTLPGVGESRAADIIAYREKNGNFVSCEDIMKVPGIKTSVYEKICDKITVK